MHPLRRQRLIIVLLVVLGAGSAVGLAAYALRQNIDLFHPPVELAGGQVPVGKKIRAGGMVVAGSLARSPDSLRVTFAITDYKATVPVVYTGILPDLFAEGQGVVAKGTLDADGVFQASEVLAKHDENYMPPEVKDMLPPAEEAGAHAAALGLATPGESAK